MNLATFDITPDTLDTAGRALAAAGPVCMVNLLRYRPHADYGDRTDLPPCSGREAYLQRYVPAFARVAAAVAPGEPFAAVFVGSVQATLVAPDGEAWDDVAVLEYPSFAVLRRIIESAEYAADAAPHRRAALADWRFLATTRVALPG